MSVQPICKSCGQPIWGNYLNALGATWHPEHFMCAACGRPIGGSSFQLYQGAPYHLECYRDRVAPRCAYCGKPLVIGNRELKLFVVLCVVRPPSKLLKRQSPFSHNLSGGLACRD